VIGRNGAVPVVERLDAPVAMSPTTYCQGMAWPRTCHDVVTWMVSHYALVLGLIGLVAALLVIWPLSHDYRRRWRRRRQIKHCVNNPNGAAATMTNSEELTSLIQASRINEYGSSDGTMDASAANKDVLL
jgi:hypothetical protein